jgi:hypothetical protein
MQLLFYASKNSKNENRLAAAIQAATPGRTIERFTRLADFRDRLRSIVEPNSIMVLMALDRDELLQIQAFRDMLTEIYIILVLPDEKKSTIKLAHLLKPRFLSSIQGDFSVLNQIISKMLQAPHGSPASPYNAGNPSTTSLPLPMKAAGLKAGKDRVPKKRKITAK